MIHLKEVFQIEEGDKTTPTQVPLKFEDGTWLATGAPWNANLNGLPRFQIILTETGIRFFGTKTTSSTYLEEIFYDSIEADSLRLPKFISGENTIDIINVDGTGVDAMEGNLSITAGGKFTIADIDSENLFKVVITLNNPLKGDTFVPVLPKGISYSLAEKDGQLILTLIGNASKTDYETSLISLMFRGTDASYKNNTASARQISVDIYDDFGAYHSIEGKLNYVGGGEVVKLTQFDFSEADIIFNVLKNAEQSNTGGNSLMTDDHFVLGDSHKIDISDLLIGANEQNIEGFVKLDFDSKDHKVTLLVDRDGDPLNEKYKMEKLLVLSNQSKEISLQELLDHQQFVF